MRLNRNIFVSTRPNVTLNSYSGFTTLRAGEVSRTAGRPRSEYMGIVVKQSVLGIGISPTSYGEVAEACRGWIANPGAGRNRYICVTSVHGIMTAVFDG